MGFAVLLACCQAVVGAVQEFSSDDSSQCVHFHRPGKVLIYKKDTAVFPIGISVPSDLVAESIPRKVRVHAAFVGSSCGGEVSEYKFGPMEEDRYQDFYRRHRFAHTKRKGGWDAVRHAEILAMGTVPNFAGLDKAPHLAVPFVPKALLLKTEELLPYSKRLEAAYNATVEQLLDHTRRCLTAESMAARVLREMGLWPTQRPLRLLYITCGFGFSGAGDGWQGPVSIGIFLGLHALLRQWPGSRIVDAPAMEPDPSIWPEETVHRSNFWYLAKDSDPWIHEEDLRQRMYGYGFSYARRLSLKDLATQAERDAVPDSLFRHEFDGVIYGKVGPAQGCDPLPFFDVVRNAGYPAERVALIYGGDFGLETKRVAEHARYYSGYGIIFFREMIAPPEDFHWISAQVFPRACYADPGWNRFFQLWRKRLDCPACDDVDRNVRDELWDHLWPVSRGFSWQTGNGLEVLPPCWSGLLLLAFPMLKTSAEAELKDLCDFFNRQLHQAARHVTFGRCVLPRPRCKGSIAFRGAFGVQPSEVKTFVRSICRKLSRKCAVRGTVKQ
ncbi:unnamed protein product [Cladocopium goreaui]|uniref:Non-specific serine/threonine protein kinase n=1 Tax=Cladocopium goreaui TaxID=2562237 RepID=A0A9P1G2B9_9DINO|nr:unnamed protein product [Cladocopium goreaui]